MPEKTAARTGTNGATRPVAEKAPVKIAETTRRHVREAEKVGEDAFRMYNELVSTTASYYFDTLDRTLSDTIEIMTRAEHAIDGMTAVYRQSYVNGIKLWEGYWQDVNRIFARPR